MVVIEGIASPNTSESQQDTSPGEDGLLAFQGRASHHHRRLIMQTDWPHISVVIPVLNELENLELFLPSLRQAIDELGLAAEILVVDGGSTDESQRVAERLGARVIPPQDSGFGGALLAGFAAAT